jgi:hypothetical protein
MGQQEMKFIALPSVKQVEGCGHGAGRRAEEAKRKPPDLKALHAEAEAAYKERELQREQGVRGEGPSNEDEAVCFVHCPECLGEVMAMLEVEGYARPDYECLSVGWTPIGLQVWCVRHNCNVLHVDFEGYQHPGNDTAPEGEQSCRRPLR